MIWVLEFLLWNWVYVDFVNEFLIKIQFFWELGCECLNLYLSLFDFYACMFRDMNFLLTRLWEGMYWLYVLLVYEILLEDLCNCITMSEPFISISLLVGAWLGEVVLVCFESNAGFSYWAAVSVVERTMFLEGVWILDGMMVF